jgi:EAL domain-containing protein (putative c-di-GMP-specific phosphodiesterase class I)
MRTSRVSGVEALLRWHDPEMGAVSPATFIPLAEDIGLIGQLGSGCCAARTDRRSAGRTRCRRCASVNVSPRQLASGDFCSVVRRVLDASGLPAHQLELEITEGALVAPGRCPRCAR